MSNDFYCDEVLSGRTAVNVVAETENVRAYHHTRPSYPVHIVVIPKTHVDSFLTLDVESGPLLVELMRVVQAVAREVATNQGACRVVTNLGDYQESKHLHWHIVAGPLKRSLRTGW
jgi:histidine triad (HIT) family protein